MTTKKVILFLLLFFIFFSAFTLMKNNLKGRILCFGDSITFGAQVQGSGWVNLLAKKSDSISVINAGRSGRRTSDKKELLPVLEKNEDASFVLIFLGVNDLKDGNDSLVAACVDNMEWMIEKTKEIIPQAKIILLAPSGINLKDMSELNRGKKYNESTFESLAKLEKKYKELAEKELIGFISLFNTVSSENFLDGLHPNKNGHQQIAEKVWDELNKIVTQ
jgi:acyl-CoA thioesterase I